jgi:hypothetical protein
MLDFKHANTRRTPMKNSDNKKNLITTITHAKELGEMVTFSELAHPLVNLNHVFRLPLSRQGKECSTTMPLMLYLGAKLRAMDYEGIGEGKEEQILFDRVLKKTLRSMLSDFRGAAEATSRDICVATSFQRKIFRYVVWGEPLICDPETDLLDNTSANQAHTVSGRKGVPSFTIQSYIARWLIERHGLNENTPLTTVNPDLKATAAEVCAAMNNESQERWKPYGSFSRRVQNHHMALAFASALPEAAFMRPLINPALDL